MTWHFCPHCGDRINEHTDDGCTHVDEYDDGSYHRIPCECKQPHTLLMVLAR